MKTLFQYYPFNMKISNNIFFGPILMELHYLFMNGMFLHYSLEIVSPFPLRTRSEIVFHNFFFPQYEIALFVIDIRTTHIGYFFLNNFGPIVFFDLLFA